MAFRQYVKKMKEFTKGTTLLSVIKIVVYFAATLKSGHKINYALAVFYLDPAYKIIYCFFK